MISIDHAIHFGFIWNIRKKRWRARNYSTHAKSLVCGKPGSLFIAFHEKATRSIIVSAGIIRISGKEMAELPLVATSIEGQEQVIVSEALEADHGGCVLCRSHDFSPSGFGSQTIIICDQCEKEYHVRCLKEHDMDDLKELPL